MESILNNNKNIYIHNIQDQNSNFINGNPSFMKQKKGKISNKSNSQKKYNFLPLSTFKEYFKSCIKYNDFTKNRKSEELNKIYLKCRNEYQSYVTDVKNSHGLKLHGTKIYENLPLNIFNDNYIINTSNISKELQYKGLEYFFPYNEYTRPQKKEYGEKIKLTPIPYKNNNLIDDEIEKNKIITAKRSAVFMRRLEYTHLIKDNKYKNIENPEYSNSLMNLSNKLCILKGAVLIIEDWWKKILVNISKKKKKEIEDSKNEKINCQIFGGKNCEFSINFTQSNLKYNKNETNFINFNKINDNINNKEEKEKEKEKEKGKEKEKEKENENK